MKKRVYAFGLVFVLLVVMVIVVTQFSNVDENLAKEDDSVAADSAVQSFSVMDIGASQELVPGDILIGQEAVSLDVSKENAIFHASCSYGNVGNLKVYYGSKKGSTTNSLGYFTATQGKWYGELIHDLPAGTWYFTIENGGSHNIMVDSITFNASK